MIPVSIPELRPTLLNYLLTLVEKGFASEYWGQV
jgi:hypothetical protein